MLTPNPFTILVVAATDAELAPLRRELAERTQHFGHDAGVTFQYLATGVGPVVTGIALTEHLFAHPCDVILDVGLAGALDREIALGEVCVVGSETFGDLGAEASDGTHLSLYDLGFANADGAPDGGGLLRPLPPNTAAHSRETNLFFELVAERFGESRTKRGTTVSQAHGTQLRIDRFREGNDAEVETMEGAAVFLVALRQNVPCVQIRAISNYVEPRNRDAWQIGLAMERLTAEVLDLLLALREKIRAAPVLPPPPSR